MKKSIYPIGVLSALCILFLAAGNAFSAKLVNWEIYTIKVADGWAGSVFKKNLYKLKYNSNGKYGIVVLGDINSSYNEEQYNKFLTGAYTRLAGNPKYTDVVLNKVTPYRVLGMKNVPAIVFVSKGKRFFCFAPYVNHRAYYIIVGFRDNKSKTVPGYVIEMLDNITLNTKEPRQIINKMGGTIQAQGQAAPANGPREKFDKTRSSVPERQNAGKVASSSSSSSFGFQSSSGHLNKAGTGDATPYFSELAPIFKEHFRDLSELRNRWSAAKTKQEKAQIRSLAKPKREKLKAAIAQFCTKNPIIGSNIPFKAVGDLPFTVQQVKVNMLSYSRMEFTIKAKLNQDIKDSKGKVKQRMEIYFAAFDKNGRFIKDTSNWGTNDGWISLNRGIIYDAQGHWNGIRLQNMGNFKYIKIMSKSDYDKL